MVSMSGKSILGVHRVSIHQYKKPGEDQRPWYSRVTMTTASVGGLSGRDGWPWGAVLLVFLACVSGWVRSACASDSAWLGCVWI